MSEIFYSKNREIIDYNLRLTRIHYTVIYLSLGIMLTEFAIHIFDTDQEGINFAFQNIFFSILLSTVFILILSGNTTTVAIEDLGTFTDFIFNSVLLIGINLAVNILLQFSFEVIPYNVQPAEYYIFYVNTAIAEEFCFRGVGITAFRQVFQKIFDPKRQRTLINFFALITTALLFMVSHLAVYGDDLRMLFSTFFAGLLYGLFFMRTKNLLIPIVAHATNNVVGYLFLQQSLAVPEEVTT